MQTRLETSSQRELRHAIQDFEHDAWLAYRRAKYGPDAPDLCCDPHSKSQLHPLIAFVCPDEVAISAA